jgi:hypothetical protein
MPLTNAEKQARFRARKMAENAEAFKLKEAERQRKMYKDKKATVKVEPIEPKEPIKELQPLKKRKNPINKSVLNDNSKIIYKSFIKQFYKYYTNDTLDDSHDIIKAIDNVKYSYKNIKKDFAFLFNKQTFIDIINRYNNKLNFLYAIVIRLYGFTPIVKKLYPYMQDSRNTYEINRANRTIDENITNIVSFKIDDIINNIDKNKDKLNYTERIIYALMMSMPTRRAHDYRLCKIINHKPNEKTDKKFNYYHNGIIYIFNTKNKKYDVIDLPSEILQFIDIKNEWLLGKLYNPTRLSKIITKMMYKIYDIKINATLIRRLYADYLRSLNLNAYEWNKQANKMGHSLAENIKYTSKKSKT